ncbi:hypothetical protein EYF80_065297 [Liparis tanakae]|uniref:Uncharacterized protein n=1 Tax=Liparis tanakae TaxID=230148 RepID=A0A4Z2E741_9TELE|nr:hypothetical protein EYF80_065297 [Liparis tanakae]
MCRWRSRP